MDKRSLFPQIRYPFHFSFGKRLQIRATKCIKGIKSGRTHYSLLRLKYALKHFSVEEGGI